MADKYNFMQGWSTPFDAEQPGADQNNFSTSSSDNDLRSSNEAPSHVPMPQKQEVNDIPNVAQYMDVANNAVGMVDDLVSKNYLERLNCMPAIKGDMIREKDIVLFKIDLMAYDKDEYATDKFISVFSAMTFTNNTVFLIVDGFEDHTDFYLGVKNNDESYPVSVIATTFENSIKGQFPGIRLSDLSIVPQGKKKSPQYRIFRDINAAKCISSYVGIPSLKSDGGRTNYTNSNYIQGIEKLADAMSGKRYTAIVIAQNQMPSSVNQMRSAYEDIYTQISCMAQQQLAYSTNESLAHALTRSQGKSTTTTRTISNGSSRTETENKTHSEGTSKSENWSNGESKPNFWSKGAQLAGPLMEAGAILTMSGVGAPIGGAVMAGGAVLGLGGVLGGKTKNKSEGGSKGTTTNDSISHGTSEGTSHSESNGLSSGESLTDSEGNTSSIGSSKNFTITLHNKNVEEILKKIDRQLERISEAEGNGLWSTATYFLSYEDDKTSALSGASIFRSIVQGEKSYVEKSALNSWKMDDDKKTISNKVVLRSVCALSHPSFAYSSGIQHDIVVEGSSLLSTRELAMLMGLPRKSVPGLPVVEHISLGKEVITSNGSIEKEKIDLGYIYDQGAEHKNNIVKLDGNSLTQHVFVTGSTGCGKSETVYKIINEALKLHSKFLVIEPAKGEYKSVYGDANVFGTNPLITPLLRVNPFRFPNGIHVLEHIDRLTEIFNVCWPMYAAMPAVLKKSVLNSYEKCGWDLYNSSNKYGTDFFPTFVDLLSELELSIKASAYSEEVKGNYIGSLVTRVESLTNGINGEIFSNTEVGDNVLFDQNTIVDLSRVGSQETKSLIMGVLIMRLNEYRMATAKEANVSLRHLTILEEAHNILKRASTDQSMEGSNVTGKSVELLINSIAEMRTYGEGFVIVDQSPTSVHAAAIKNTNTKIVMRLPDGDDRRIAGKSTALKDEQLDEIAKLPTGTAIVYQNNWLQPVMCKIKMTDFERKVYIPVPDTKQSVSTTLPIDEILKLLLKGRLYQYDKPDLVAIEESLASARIPMSSKRLLLDFVQEYRDNHKLEIWKDENFVKLSHIVTDLLGLSHRVSEIASSASNFDELNILLDNLIQESVNIPIHMNLTIKQILMRDYAEIGTSQLKIYNAWLTDIKKKIQ